MSNTIINNHVPADDFFGEIVSCYSRKQAIEDGNLIDVSAQAATIGFKYPVAVTDNVQKLYLSRGNHAETDAKVFHCILTDALQAIRNRSQDGDQLQYVGYFDRKSATAVPVFVHVGPGDTAEPVITIMLSQDL